MAFQLKTDRAVAREVRRLARKELESARKALMRAPRPADEAIHDARKSVKKVRAILHLVETDGGHGLSGSRKRLRAVSRTLSDLRDAKAMIDTFETLVHEDRLRRRRGYCAGCGGRRRDGGRRTTGSRRSPPGSGRPTATPAERWRGPGGGTAIRSTTSGGKR
jgi:CHAD domain-containing protein